jgi:predicted DsbA family dithiol-disulfide isomerase
MCEGGTCRLPWLSEGFQATPGNLMPIPKRVLGLPWGPADAPIIVDVYTDPLCPDCTQSHQTIHAIKERYPTAIRFNFFMLALPFHTWAYRLTQAILTVKSFDAEKARELFFKILNEDQDKFTNSALSGLTEPAVIELFVNYASQHTGIPVPDLTERFNDKATDRAARLEFKNAANNGVTGTPTIFINGSLTVIDNATKVEDWVSVIDSLLAP